MSASVAIVCPSGKKSQGHHHIDDEQGEAYIIQCQNAEHDIIDGTYGRKSCHIEQGIGSGEMSEDVFQGSNPDNDDSPHRSDEKSQMEWQCKGI